MGLIVRLHADLVKELLEAGYWNQEDVNSFIDYCNKTENIVFDEMETYDAAFSVADAIIADICCGIMISALPTMKPICAMERSNYEKELHPELTDHYYKACSEKEIIDFFIMVLKGDDPKKLERKSISDRFVMNFDGKNGYRIKEFIKAELVNGR